MARKQARKPLHKTRPGRGKNPVVQVATRHDRLLGASVTYQLERVRCGKPKCRKWHGPYWYAYFTMGNATRTLYIGKVLRAAESVLLERSRKQLKGAACPSDLSRSITSGNSM